MTRNENLYSSNSDSLTSFATVDISETAGGTEDKTETSNKILIITPTHWQEDQEHEKSYML